MKKKIIIISVTLLLIASTGLWYLHFRRINAFYFSYKNHESMTKKQDTFFKSVREEDLKKNNIKYQVKNWRDAGPKINKVFFPDNKYDFAFLHSNDNMYSIIVDVNKKNQDDQISVFSFKNNMKSVHVDIYNNSDKFKKRSLVLFKYILKKTYDNWEIRYL